MKKITYGVLTFISLGLFIGGFLIYQFVESLGEISKPLEKQIEVKFSSTSARIYMRAKAWGLGHDEILISETPLDTEERQANKKLDYVCHYTEIYYRKKEENTIVIYAPSNSITKPTKKFTNINIQVVDLNDSKNKEYVNNYKNNGLKRFSVYDEKN